MADQAGNIIIHPGIVDHLQENKVFIRILSQSACSTCHAKGACAVSDMEEKIIEVDEPHGRTLRPGELVNVKMKQSMGTRAVLLGYVIPLVILVFSIIVFVMFFNNEGLAAILSLLLLVPYYLVLYLLRSRLKQQFKFTLTND